MNRIIMIPLTKYSTYFLDVNYNDSLKYHAFYFDETDGELIHKRKADRLSFCLVNKEVLMSKIAEAMQVNPMRDVYSTIREVESLNEISRPIDFNDNYLGSLIKIVLAEMLNGTDVDRRIVAESVINRWDRRDFHSFLINGQPAKNFRAIIEKPKAYDAIYRRQKEDEGNFNRYEEFIDYLDWMFTNKSESYLNYDFIVSLLGVFKVCIQVYCRSFPMIGLGVTHYVSSPLTATHFNNVTGYQILLSDNITDLITGCKRVLAAAKEI